VTKGRVVRSYALGILAARRLRVAVSELTQLIRVKRHRFLPTEILFRRGRPCPDRGKVVLVGLSSSDNAAIRAAENVLAEAFEDPDPTTWVNCYTEDAIFCGPGFPAIEGRAALLAAAAQITISSMEIVADSTIGAGDFAATTGRATWVNGPRGSGAPTSRRRFLMVWRRDADGRWQIARELLNEDL
jgi:ketosteroid isomerase-like protein